MQIKASPLLNIPEKLQPIIPGITEYSYLLLEGGRSGGKTQSIARFILYLCELKPLRIVCGRELWTNIEESVYTVFKDIINEYNLNYQVLADKITHNVTGSTINFRGFRQQNSVNIKGLEGTSILWIDEAQAITKLTLDVILPTIRKEHSKVIWSMNRHIDNDPVFSAFANRRDCLHIKINYTENLFCPQKALIEAEICKNNNYDDYAHIWLGDPLLKSDDYLFSMDMLRSSLELDMDRIGIRRRIMGVDVARFGGDEIVHSILESRGVVMWEQIHQETSKYKGIDETLGKTIARQKEFSLDAIIPDDDGMGGGITDLLGDPKDYEVLPFNALAESLAGYADRRTEAYFKLKDWIEKKYLKILNDSILFEQLLAIKYKYNTKGQKIIESKVDMRKRRQKDFPNAIWKSPDRADALMMAVFFADSLMGPQHNERLPAYAISNDRIMVEQGLPTHAKGDE